MAKAKADRAHADDEDLPDIGKILKRMRTQRGLTIREVAEASNLSPSFLSDVERGDSDISLGRLARIAKVFDHDVGSLLGYSARLGKPTFVSKMDRRFINRGKGVKYELLHLPGVNLELQLISLEPKTRFREEMAHEGIDVVLVTSGELTLSIDDVDYTMPAGECAVYAAGFRHKLRNDSSQRTTVVAVTTGRTS